MITDGASTCQVSEPGDATYSQSVKSVVFIFLSRIKCRATPLLSGLLVVCLALAACKRPPVPLTHEIYMWQHAWSPAVREAATTALADAGGLTPLAARISWHGNPAAVAWTDVPWQHLAAKHQRLGAAIRAEPLPSPAAALPAALDTLRATARECLRRAAASGVTLAEIQLDFDAAESQLAIYATWLRGLRGAVSPLPVTFTALPCWLRQAAFADLARAADGYVLQVHAAERPTPDSTALCDPAQAQRWVEQAARAAPGVPFRVALPTYTYEIAFAPDNSCLGVVAEGEAREWPVDSKLVFLGADASALAGLLKTWNAARPAELTGVLWFRLPLATDAHNWRWPTLRTLIRGGTPQPALSARARLDPSGKLCDLTLNNTGDADATPPSSVTVRWQNSTCEAGDPLAGYAMTAGDSCAVFRPRGAAPATARRVIRPGQSLALGWLRFSQSIPEPTLSLTTDESPPR